jgi:hypothetical protein
MTLPNAARLAEDVRLRKDPKILVLLAAQVLELGNGLASGENLNRRLSGAASEPAAGEGVRLG